MLPLIYFLAEALKSFIKKIYFLQNYSFSDFWSEFIHMRKGRSETKPNSLFYKQKLVLMIHSVLNETHFLVSLISEDYQLIEFLHDYLQANPYSDISVPFLCMILNHQKFLGGKKYTQAQTNLSNIITRVLLVFLLT